MFISTIVKQYSRFLFFLCFLHSAVKASELLENSSDQTILKTPTYLYSFFDLPCLQKLPRDLRNKLVPLCFCAQLIKTPLREITKKDNEDDFFRAAFNDRGTHLAYSQDGECKILDLKTGDITYGGRFPQEGIKSLAFRKDDSKIAFLSCTADHFMEQNLVDYCAVEHVPLVIDNDSENSSNGHDPLIVYSEDGKIIVVKTIEAVSLYNPQDQSQEFFLQKYPVPDISEWGRYKPKRRCIHGSLIAFAGPERDIDFFSCETKTFTKFLINQIDSNHVHAIDFNHDGSLLLIVIRGEFIAQWSPSSYRVDIYDVATRELRFSINLGMRGLCKGRVESASFMDKSRKLLITGPYDSLLYDIRTATLVAQFTHSTYLPFPEGRPELLASYKRHNNFEPDSHCLSKDRTLFATMSWSQIKVYGLDPLFSLIEDRDTDKGFLERILFLQYLRIITGLGLSLSKDGLQVAPRVQSWQQNRPNLQAPSLACAALRLITDEAALNELEAVFKSFTVALQAVLREQYQLPW